MNKTIISLLVCCILLLMSGCQTKYQRISFERDTLSEGLDNHLSADTEVVNTVDAVFPNQMPIYQITERSISQEDYEQMLDKLMLSHNPKHLELEENTLFYNLVSFSDFSRGYFNMSDAEVERVAWEIFSKIPFIEGNYEYLGITSTTTLNDSSGDHITRAGVSFSRVLGNARVLGEDSCTLYFDGSGLVAIKISMFDYEEIGTMDLISLENATTRIKNPDDFNIDANTGTKNLANSLRVDRIKLLLVNQYSRGCKILQPIYNFIGTATMENGTQAEFSSKIIAIPESMTYED